MLRRLQVTDWMVHSGASQDVSWFFQQARSATALYATRQGGNQEGNHKGYLVSVGRRFM